MTPPPFLTFLTPTFRRPVALAACMASVQGQTAVADVEHVIVADYVGRGVGGMFAQLPNYVDAVHGDYVHVLADDDELAATDVVARFKAFAVGAAHPPAVCVQAYYEQHGTLPRGTIDPPQLGHIGLGCLVTRRDIWRAITLSGGYAPAYEGDFAFAKAVWDCGWRWTPCDVLLTRGRCRMGEPE